MVTGAMTLDRPDGAEILRVRVTAYCAEHRLPDPLAVVEAAAEQLPVHSPRAASPEHVTTPGLSPAPMAAPLIARDSPLAADGSKDLAANRPGQAAREQADAALAAMRERSRVGTFLARAFDLKTDERAWRVGSGGEETVGAKLDKLKKHGWHVLHAVPVGQNGTDIDHVVIGHGGVFTLNTKTHPGGRVWVGKHQVRVNGFPTDYLRKARAEGARAARLLTDAVGFDVPVRPALVFLTGTLFPDVTIKQHPDVVLILDRMDVVAAFRRAPHRLAPEQVTAIYEQARRSMTWQRSLPRSHG